MGKTETIRERAVWVYLPTIEEKRRWAELARKEGVSLSKWILETVRDAVERGRRTRGELEEENEALRRQVSGLRDRVRQLSIIREKLERELRRYRAEPFLVEGFEGVRRYNRELVELLRSTRGVDGKPRALSGQDMLEYLGIDPTEEEAVKAISSQLANLEAYGLVRSTPKGWRWVE